MNRQTIALVAVAVFVVLALLLRPAVMRLRTGRWGLNGVSGRVGSLGWWGVVSFIAALLCIPIALRTESTIETFAIPGLILMSRGAANHAARAVRNGCQLAHRRR